MLDARLEYTADAALLDGSVAHIRSLRRTDHDELERLFETASDESIYRRFFALGRTIARQYVETICAPGAETFGVVAIVDGRIVGFLAAEPTSSDSADISVFVEETYHGHGVGTVLVEHAERHMRGLGYHRLTADALATNSPMLHVLRREGFRLTPEDDPSVVAATIDLDSPLPV
jgi:RimJ/RimL family protein N-acetyltransferase